MIRTGVGLALLMGAAPAFALPPFWETLKSTYAVPADSKLGQARCLTCHLPGGNKWNAFGLQVEAALNKSEDGFVSPALLKSIELKDADADGVNNGDELRAFSLPGDAKVKPDAVPATANVPPPTQALDEQPLIPSHSYHPAVVHFPIAFYMLGAFLLLVRRWATDERKESYDTVVRVLNAAGAASLAVVIPTGIAALLRSGHELKGNVLIHVILAVLTAMCGLAGWKNVGGKLVWWTLAAGLFAGLAGHWGALLVYSG